MPASQYGEPKFPVRLSYATSADQEKALRDLAGTDEFESLGDAIRTLLNEALLRRQVGTVTKAVVAEFREQVEKVDGPKIRKLTEKAVKDMLEDNPSVARQAGDATCVRHGKADCDRCTTATGLARVGDQLATEKRPAMSRAQLIAQERGEQ